MPRWPDGKTQVRRARAGPYEAGYYRYGRIEADAGEPDEHWAALVASWAAATGREVYPGSITVTRVGGRAHVACAAR